MGNGKILVRRSTKELSTRIKTKLSESDIHDTLDSSSKKDALSANMGKILNEKIGEKISKEEVVDDLNTEDSVAPLSANQGVVLKDMIENALKKLVSEGSISIKVEKTFKIDASSLSDDESNGRTIIINESSQIKI